jgi:hypothetical protein
MFSNSSSFFGLNLESKMIYGLKLVDFDWKMIFLLIKALLHLNNYLDAILIRKGLEKKAIGL